MSAFKVLGVLLFCAVIGCQGNGFFDGFDIFKQFNHEVDRFGAQSKAHEHHMAHQLSSLFETSGEREPLEDLEIEGADADEVEVPEIPGLTTGVMNGGGGFFNLFGQGFGRQPWWKGPNVCVEREEVDESAHSNDTTPADGNGDDDGVGMFGSFEFSTCRQGATRYTCTTKIRSHGIKKTMTVKYQCCHGHKRVGNNPGCTRVDLKSIAETAIELGGKDFIQLIKTANLEEKLSESNLTVFVPSDDALRDFSDSMEEANQVEFFVPPSERRRRSVQGMSMREIALGHIAQGMFDASEMENEQIIISDNHNGTLRMNVYPSSTERLITCNCARLTKSDNLAENGIIHVVDRVIRPVTKTLAELVEQDENLSTLKSMLEKADMMDKLREEGHLTLLAPNDEAFRKLPASTLQRFMEGHSCLKNVLHHHIIPHTLCSTAVETLATTANKAGDVIHLERKLNGKVFVEGVQIIIKDIMATNGIIQVIEEVIVPDSAKTVSEVLASNNFTTFLSLLKEANLIESLDAMENVTLFVPTDKALAHPKVQSRLDAVKSDSDKLRNVLLFHTTAPQTQSCDLANDLALKTNMADQSIKINLYAMQPFFMGYRQLATAQCARLSTVDIRACGGVIHAVDRLLTIPKHNILDQINEDEKFSTLSSILKDTEIESTLKEKSPITFLAPTNEAFDEIDPKNMERLQSDKEFAAKVLKKHILPETVCCAGVQTTAWPFTSRVETMRGDSIPMRRDSNGGVHFGTTTVHHCDEIATNGVIHSVNRMMLPRSHTNSGNIEQRFSNPNVEIFLYGL